MVEIHLSRAGVKYLRLLRNFREIVPKYQLKLTFEKFSYGETLSKQAENNGNFLPLKPLCSSDELVKS